MRNDVFRYEFRHDVPAEDIEASVLLALVATESLHGESAVELAAPHYLDLERRRCVVDESTTVGRDFNRVLLGFLRRELTPDAFSAQRVAVDAPSAA